MEKKKFKVALISLVRRGGMVHYHSQLANALAKITDTCVIVPQMVSDDYFSPQVEIIKINTGTKARDTFLKTFNPLTYLNLRKAVQKTKAQVFHVTSPHVWNTALSYLIKGPLFYTAHDPHHHSGERLFRRGLDQIFRNRIDACFIHSRKDKQKLVEQGFKGEKIFVVPHGDYTFFCQWQDPKIKEQNEILFFGRIEDYKGLDVLLKAAPRIFSALPDWKIVIAGDGKITPYQDLLKDSRIKLINRYLEDREVAGLFQKAKIVVLPYKDATQSGIIPIAFAFKKPVIATDVGGLDEVVEDGKSGFLVQANDKDLLSKAVIKLVQDERARQAMGKHGHQSLQKIAWEGIALKHLEGYQKILADKQ